MKFSLITPCNSTTYLTDLWNSIKSQTYKDWEWILYFNKLSSTDIELAMQLTYDSSGRVKYKIDKTNTNKIGELKHIAFGIAEGDVLCEVDQDDMLRIDCLDKLKMAYESDKNIGFVYSDAMTYDCTVSKEFVPFSSLYGWKYDIQSHNGVNCVRMKSFGPSAAAFSTIHYQPDHIRTWRRDVYESLGGHDVNLEILDDQDLLSRTYLYTKCLHITEPLYIYRYHENNSYKSRLSKISELRPKMQLKYLPKLVRKDAIDSNKLLIDLGGGINPMEGFTSMDLRNADIICDLNEDWKLEDNSVGYLHASHVLEHLRDPLHSMSELYRVLCDGGYAYIEVPSTDGRGAFQDPTHVSYWNKNSFMYYTREEQNRFIRHYSGKNLKFKLIYLDEVDWGDKIIVVRAWLQAIKSDKYRPGLCDIRG